MWLLILAALTLIGCSDEPTGARLWLTRGGLEACGGVRVERTRILTAAHCGKELAVEGHSLTWLRDFPDRDIAEFSGPEGPATPIGKYDAEPLFAADLQGGTVEASIQAHWPDVLVFKPTCWPGDSGSPVRVGGRVVAIVVWRNPLDQTCGADEIR